MRAIVLAFLVALSTEAAVEPGALRLNTGPQVIATYTNFYNDSDLKATCVAYSDGTAMLLADGIVPYRKPKFIKLTEGELKRLSNLVRTSSAKIASPKDYVGFNAVPLKAEYGEALGALYYGKAESLREGLDLVEMKPDSEVGKEMRRLCGYGDDL